MPKVIKTKVYSFKELTPEAKETAIEQIRESYYQYNDFAQWAIDDDYLFEPKNDELVKLFGEAYTKLKEPMIGNTRNKIYFDTDRNSFLDCENAMVINEDKLFLKWLGIPENLIGEVNYSIYTPSGRNRDTIIEFEFNGEENTPEIEKILSEAENKFNDHIADCLKNISEQIDYRFTDEAITEDIESNDTEFTKEGKIFKYQ